MKHQHLINIHEMDKLIINITITLIIMLNNEKDRKVKNE